MKITIDVPDWVVERLMANDSKGAPVAWCHGAVAIAVEEALKAPQTFSILWFDGEGNVQPYVTGPFDTQADALECATTDAQNLLNDLADDPDTYPDADVRDGTDVYVFDELFARVVGTTKP